jgi:hypothetical protein
MQVVAPHVAAAVPQGPGFTRERATGNLLSPAQSPIKRGAVAGGASQSTTPPKIVKAEITATAIKVAGLLIAIFLRGMGTQGGVMRLAVTGHSNDWETQPSIADVSIDKALSAQAFSCTPGMITKMSAAISDFNAQANEDQLAKIPGKAIDFCYFLTYFYRNLQTSTHFSHILPTLYNTYSRRRIRHQPSEQRMQLVHHHCAPGHGRRQNAQGFHRRPRLLGKQYLRLMREGQVPCHLQGQPV